MGGGAHDNPMLPLTGIVILLLLSEVGLRGEMDDIHCL